MSALELLPVSSTRSSNLAFALLSLPRARRADAILFYRFCRTIDDIADEPQLTKAEKYERLDAWRNAVEGGLPCGLEGLVARHAIDRALLAEIIRGCASDVEAQRFATLADLELYCWRVACAVGLVSIKIFGCRDSRSERYALHLGHALQLTNILRDIREDAGQGRIYLPQEELARFGVGEEEILQMHESPGFEALLRSHADRAKARFAAAIPPPSDFLALLPARIMAAVYQKILTRIEREDFPVLKKRVTLDRQEKLTATLGALLGRY